jgi:hypothetical protein
MPFGGEGGNDGPGALDEQPHTLRRGAVPDAERRDRPQVLVRDPQALAAGGHDLDGGGAGQDPLDQLRYGVEHVLTVVQHQQPLAPLKGSRHALGHRHTGPLGDTQHRRHCVGHRRGVTHGPQLDHPHSFGEV